MLLLLLALVSPVPFESGQSYACIAGPHQFEIQTDSKNQLHLSRYALVIEGKIAMPRFAYDNRGNGDQIQWHTLRLNDRPSALFHLSLQTWQLSVAVLDQEGDLQITLEHATDCQLN
jgi:hypothetical protein